MILRTGVDLVEIERLRRIAPAIRKRFLQRVYTPAELALAQDQDETLAGRFAAKEAVAKALGCGIGLVSWQDLEIINDSAGAPWLNLKGEAQRMAVELHLEIWSLSISHTATHAVAMAVALGEIKQGPDYR